MIQETRDTRNQEQPRCIRLRDGIRPRQRSTQAGGKESQSDRRRTSKPPITEKKEDESYKIRSSQV